MSEHPTTFGLGAALGTGVLAQEVGSVIPGAVNAITDTSGLVYKASDRYDINTQSRLAIRTDGNINHNIIFHGPGGKEVGRFDFNEGTVKFEGDANEAAKVFTEWARKSWDDLRVKDKTEALDEVIHDIIAESSGELYSEEEKVAMLTCLQLAQKRKDELSPVGRSEDRIYPQAPLTPVGVQAQAMAALAPEGKSL